MLIKKKNDFSSDNNNCKIDFVVKIHNLDAKYEILTINHYKPNWVYV